ncbi:unnamed protein product [Mucor hiemalis]
MSDIFKDLKAFILPTKLSEYDIANFQRVIEKHGGSICRNQHEATVILTILKSPTRINRNIQNHKIPVLDIQWIKECAKSNELLSNKDRVIIEPTFAQPVVSPTSDILNRKFSKLHPEDLQFDDDLAVIDLDDSESDEEEADIDIAPNFVNTKYECLRPTPYVPNYNKKLVSLLLILERKRQLDGEDKRSLSYRHAISAIKAYPREIKSSKEAAKIIGVGKKMSDKIEAFLKTGTIEEAEALRSDEKFRTLSLFNQVFGVGAVTAHIWWNLGYRTLQEVLDKAKLTPIVRLGIELFPDFSQLMERNDVEEVIQIISKTVESIDSNCFITPVGGYRRGKTKNGDLDLLISTKRGSVQGLLNKLLNLLIDEGYIKHRLWHSSELKDRKQRNINTKLRGSRQKFDDFEKCFCAFVQPSSGIHRQVDLIVVPLSELPLAILGWTGSRQFERSIRDFAKKVLYYYCD